MRYGLLLSGSLLFAASATAQEVDTPRSIELPNGGFERAADDGAPADWYASTRSSDSGGAGYIASIDTENSASGSSSARLEGLGDIATGQYGTLSKMLDAKSLRGRKVRMTARVRVGAKVPEHVGLWLRENRQVGGPYFIDNMVDRPITSREWATYVIEADVAPETKSVSFGFSIGGEGVAWVDDLKLEDIGPATLMTIEDPTARPGPRRDGPVDGDVGPSAISDIGVANLQAFARLYGLVRWFHPTKEAMSVDWDRFLIAHIPAVEAAESPRDLAAVLNEAFAPLAPSLQIEVGSIAKESEIPVSEKHIRWKHTGYAQLPPSTYSSSTEIIPASEAPDHWTEVLPGGVAINLPVSVPMNSFRQTLPIREAEMGVNMGLNMGKPEGWVPAGFDRTTRLAGIVSFWALQGHFYPYWDVVDTDWDAAFEPALRQAALASDDIAYHTVLRQFVERLQDGHGNVWYRHDAAFILPLDWAWIDNQLVVTVADAEAVGVEQGMIVKAIDGVPAAAKMTEAMGLISGSKHGKRYRAENELRTAHDATERTLLLEDEAGDVTEVTLTLRRATRENWYLEKRPEMLTELEPGVLYADLTRIRESDLGGAMARFETADAIIFDVRGYPQARSRYLAHMTDQKIRSAAMKTAIQTRPDARFDSFSDGGWTIAPELPRYTNKLVWITDSSAGSYPESILGTVKPNNLGTIIGGATAGANGNYTKFRVPGGYDIGWTGMQVVNRDGSQHHNIGVLPDITVEPTLAGVRAGRDEVLEAALAEVRRQMAQD